jgi:uncharacterized protein (DUF427 family)
MIDRESLDASRLAPFRDPSRRADLAARSSMVRVSRDGENTVAMSAEERRNEDG